MGAIGRARTILLAVAVAGTAQAGESKAPPAAKEMSLALEAVNKSLGLESMPKPHCLKWGYGHQITAAEVRACVDQAIKGATLPELGKGYVLAVLMGGVGPQTVIALALGAPGWAVLSCDPGKPCPARHAGTDKMGKRVVDRTERACDGPETIWVPEKKSEVCPTH